MNVAVADSLPVAAGGPQVCPTWGTWASPSPRRPRRSSLADTEIAVSRRDLSLPSRHFTAGLQGWLVRVSLVALPSWPMNSTWTPAAAPPVRGFGRCRGCRGAGRSRDQGRHRSAGGVDDRPGEAGEPVVLRVHGDPKAHAAALAPGPPDGRKDRLRQRHRVQRTRPARTLGSQRTRTPGLLSDMGCWHRSPALADPLAHPSGAHRRDPVDRPGFVGWRHWWNGPSWTRTGCVLHEPQPAVAAGDPHPAAPATTRPVGIGTRPPRAPWGRPSSSVTSTPSGGRRSSSDSGACTHTTRCWSGALVGASEHVRQLNERLDQQTPDEFIHGLGLTEIPGA
jgi:hypothetical protein